MDDYHEIETSTIHESMVYLLDHLPPLFHLLLIARSDPPFPLARWRVGGQLAEIRADDLRFTISEAAAFLEQTMGLSLTEQDIAALEERTEGWIAGLQLAALSMQGQQNAEEVFNRQSAEIQSFLPQTAVLTRMSASLCNAIPMTYAGITGLLTWKQMKLNSTAHKWLIGFALFYITASIPLHVRPLFTQSTDYIRVFPMWFNLLLLPWYAVIMRAFRRLEYKDS